MDRDSTTYALVQYALLVGLILATVAAIELLVGVVPLWGGLAVAVAVGLAYPWLTRKAGVAPTHWE